LPVRSKTPRGRPDPLHEVATGGDVHLGADPKVLQQDRTELDQAESRLAPGDDGVHTGTVGVVDADTAVAIAVKSGGVATGPTVAFAGNEVDERRFFRLLHESLSLQVRVAKWALARRR
jgi:hypothetical protein